MRTIDFWFDTISPYAYFAWKRIHDMSSARGIAVRPRPVLFAALLEHWGQLGPAEIEPKRAYTFRACLRFAAHLKVPFQGPATHPFNPLTSLRLCMPEVSGMDQTRVIDAIFDAGWGQGIDLGSPQALKDALDAAGLDGAGMLERSQFRAVKSDLREQTAEAVKLGVFGVPTMIIDDQLFWGNDSLFDLALYLDGRDPLQPADLQRFLSRPRGADRSSLGSKKS